MIEINMKNMKNSSWNKYVYDIKKQEDIFNSKLLKIGTKIYRGKIEAKCVLLRDAWILKLGVIFIVSIKNGDVEN